LPTYEYACKACGHRLEAVQKFTDDALTVCPDCGGALRKVFGAPGIVLKGSGFYKTDTRAADKRSSSDKSSSNGSDGSKADTKTDTGTKTDSGSKSESSKSESSKSESSKSESSTGSDKSAKESKPATAAAS
jgi:putative FmdB family regulatory protein